MITYSAKVRVYIKSIIFTLHFVNSHPKHKINQTVTSLACAKALTMIMNLNRDAALCHYSLVGGGMAHGPWPIPPCTNTR